MYWISLLHIFLEPSHLIFSVFYTISFTHMVVVITFSINKLSVLADKDLRG